jgi:hypothetical protein
MFRSAVGPQVILAALGGCAPLSMYHFSDIEVTIMVQCDKPSWFNDLHELICPTD